MKDLFFSSVDPNKIALTIRGLSVLVPSVVVLLSFFNINVGAEELNELINALAQLIVMALSLVSFVVTVYGLVRKIYFKIFPPAE